MFPWMMPNATTGGQMSLLSMMNPSSQGGFFAADPWTMMNRLRTQNYTPQGYDQGTDNTPNAAQGPQAATPNAYSRPQPPQNSPGYQPPWWMQMLGGGQQQQAGQRAPGNSDYLRAGAIGLAMMGPQYPGMGMMSSPWPAIGNFQRR